MLLNTHAVDVASLSAYRIIYCVVMLFLLSPHLSVIEPVPDFLYSPPLSIVAFSESPASTTTLTTLRWCLAISLSILMVGYRTNMAAIAVAVLLLAVNSIGFSAGKINHTILSVVVPLVLSYSAWGSRFSIDSLTGRKRFRETAIPMGMLALIIAIAMATAGWSKLTGGWPDLESSAVRHYVYDF